jgi:hypothetical protein
MKSLLVSKLSLVILSMTSTTVLAHSGHLADESVHGFLHIEHVLVLAAVGLIAYAVKILRNK